MRSIYRIIYRHVKKKITTVSIFIPIVAIWLWGLRNNNLFYNLLQFLTFVLYFHYLQRINIEVGPLGKLAETYFFLLKTTQIWVITIVVVLDQSTVTFQKWVITICVVLDQNRGNVMFYPLVANLPSMFPSYLFTTFVVCI